MPYIKGESKGQITIFPESLDDYISEDNPIRVVDAFVNKLDVLEMEFDRALPSNEGRPGYDPRDMLKLHIYGYLNKIRSSHKLQTECARNIEFMEKFSLYSSNDYLEIEIVYKTQFHCIHTSNFLKMDRPSPSPGYS